AIMSEARLRETRNFLCKLFRLFATFAFRHDAICKADLQSFCRINRAACEDQIHRARMADETRQTYRAAINQRHTPAATKNTHYRIFFHHTHVAPERELKPACNSMTRNGGDHRLVENHSRWTHRSISRKTVELCSRCGGHGAISLAACNSFEISARAE